MKIETDYLPGIEENEFRKLTQHITAGRKYRNESNSFNLPHKVQLDLHLALKWQSKLTEGLREP